MGQFDTMSVSDKKTLLTAWIAAGKKHGIFTIAHVGSPVQSDAIELATFAAELGADAIASVPGYYESYASAETVADFIQPIAAAAPNLPFFFYHIPPLTHSNINAVDLLRITSDPNSSHQVPTLCGIKFVSSNLTDWFFSVQGYNHSHVLLFAPEPKMASFALGRGRGVVLAEDFYAPSFLRMYASWLRGDSAAAFKEQAWKFQSEEVFRRFGGSAAKRLLYGTSFPITRGKVDLGPPRLPAAPFDASRRDALIEALSGVNFWNETSPQNL
jgi:N-acetylneuraminate lyase